MLLPYTRNSRPCNVVHLDGWEEGNDEYAVSDIKATRKDPASKRMMWPVGWHGYAADTDSRIEDCQMNNPLRKEAEERHTELLVARERYTALDKATAANRSKPRRRGPLNPPEADIGQTESAVVPQLTADGDVVPPRRRG